MKITLLMSLFRVARNDKLPMRIEHCTVSYGINKKLVHPNALLLLTDVCFVIGVLRSLQNYLSCTDLQKFCERVYFVMLLINPHHIQEYIGKNSSSIRVLLLVLHECCMHFYWNDGCLTNKPCVFVGICCFFRLGSSETGLRGVCVRNNVFLYITFCDKFRSFAVRTPAWSICQTKQAHQGHSWNF